MLMIRVEPDEKVVNQVDYKDPKLSLKYEFGDNYFITIEGHRSLFGGMVILSVQLTTKEKSFQNSLPPFNTMFRIEPRGDSAERDSPALREASEKIKKFFNDRIEGSNLNLLEKIALAEQLAVLFEEDADAFLDELAALAKEYNTKFEVKGSSDRDWHIEGRLSPFWVRATKW